MVVTERVQIISILPKLCARYVAYRQLYSFTLCFTGSVNELLPTLAVRDLASGEPRKYKNLLNLNIQKINSYKIQLSNTISNNT
jgi:hypothetical protein